MTTQLGKLLIGLVAKDGVALKGLGGESLHGLFYRILKNRSPELASEIHSQDGLKHLLPRKVLKLISPSLEGCNPRKGILLYEGCD